MGTLFVVLAAETVMLKGDSLILLMVGTIVAVPIHKAVNAIATNLVLILLILVFIVIVLS